MIERCTKCDNARVGEYDEYYGEDMDRKPIEPTPLNAAQLHEYERMLESDLSGAEQTAMRERDPAAFEAWLDVQLSNVPMPFWQKPEINGLREGDRVRLVRGFEGDELKYDAGSTGVVVITDTSPAQIRLARESGLLEVVIDGSGAGLIGVLAHDIEKIDGRRRVRYKGEYLTVTER